MKNHQRRIRRLFALLLAAMLAVEPAGALPAVYAAEDGAEIGTMLQEDPTATIISIITRS